MLLLALAGAGVVAAVQHMQKRQATAAVEQRDRLLEALRLGEDSYTWNDWEKARGHFQQALRVAEERAAVEPTSRQAQEAAIEALRVPDRDVQAMVDDYDLRRRLIVSGLNRLGLPCHLPAGAFYAFPSVAPTGLSAMEFAERLLHEARVAVVPGDAFGAGGAGHVRCAYATSIPQLEEALNRIERFLATLPGFPVAPVVTRSHA